jgi:hypothetical protein
MRVAALVVLLALVVCVYSGARPKTRAGTTSGSAVAAVELRHEKLDFHKEVKPIFERRCQPCHFNGGAMYKRLPFDSPATIKSLGTKLFTRIKDQREQDLLRRFLAE